jgi:hypothetical protein
MEYSKIVAISGMPGLHEVKGERPDGLIVRPLNEDNSKFVSAMRHNFTSMDAIGIFVEGNETKDLYLVFWDMKQKASTVPVPDVNGPEDHIREYFNTIVEEIDDEKVYTNDMKKILKWYNAMSEADLIMDPKEIEAEQKEEAKEEAEETE